MSKILIVDSDKASRDRLIEVLKKSDPDTSVVLAEGDEAPETIRETMPDLIFLDVVMPGSDGFEICLLLKADERFKDIPVVIITSLNTLDDKIKAFKMGASDYLVKPIDENETLARVGAQLRIKRYQDRQKELIAQLRQAQSALVQSSKLSAVGTLAAGVSHEFNNILQIIRAAMELCETSHDPQEVEKSMAIVQECTARGEKIVKGLLDFARKDELQKKEPVHLKELIEQNLGLMERGITSSRVRLEVNLQPLPPLDGYAGQLSQVFINMVRNAIDAMKDSEKKILTVSLEKCDGAARITISDTGCGIPDAIQDKIFEPFMTTKGVVLGGDVSEPGTGLGLSISYGIVKRHGGDIRVESKVGTGSTFMISLPL